MLPEKLAILTAPALVQMEKKTTITPSQLLAYWQQAISYKLDSRALAGLDLFYRSAKDLGLIDKVPQLDFFPAPDNREVIQDN